MEKMSKSADLSVDTTGLGIGIFTQTKITGFLPVLDKMGIWIAVLLLVGISFCYCDATPSHAVPSWVVFNCANRPTGFYADRVRGCHVFNFCTSSGLKFEFVCPNDKLFDAGKTDCVDPALPPVSCPTIWEVPDIVHGMNDAPAEMLPGEEDLVNAVVGLRSSEHLTENRSSTRNPTESVRGLVVLPDGTTSVRPTPSTRTTRRSRRTTMFPSTSRSN